MDKIIFVAALFCHAALSKDVLSPSIIENDVFISISERERITFKEPKNDYSTLSEFDFIVVGAGAGGSVMANRLSEVDTWNVLLLEAGLQETLMLSMPFFEMTGVPDIDWGYKMAPQPNGGCPAGPDSACPYPRAKVMGGSTAVNNMLFVRGNRRDYDLWAAMGNKGWSYRDVLRYFKKMENIQIPSLRDSPFHGTDGYIPNSRLGETIFTNISLAAASQLGIPIVDYNGEDMTGISYLQTSTKDGIRYSANRGYLHPAHTRPNLYVRKSSVATRVLFEGNRAVGVEYVREGKTYTASARKEIILSAGAVNSPQLLMLSGIGPREHLEQFNIPVIQDIPVGRTLVDQAVFMGLPIVTKTVIDPSRPKAATDIMNFVTYFKRGNGSFASVKDLETLRFSEIGEDANRQHWANVETLAIAEIDTESHHYWRRFGFTNEIFEAFVKPLRHLNSFLPCVTNLRPRSIGFLNLTSASPSSAPYIDPNFFADESDFKVTLEGVKDAIRFYTSGPFKDLGAEVYRVPYPPCSHLEFMSDDYLACTIRRATVPSSHPTSTCRMGSASDPGAVVTPDLRVKGVESLRVVDASVFPTMPSGHRQVPTYMVAEKAADIVRSKYGL